MWTNRRRRVQNHPFQGTQKGIAFLFTCYAGNCCCCGLCNQQQGEQWKPRSFSWFLEMNDSWPSGHLKATSKWPTKDRSPSGQPCLGGSWTASALAHITLPSPPPASSPPSPYNPCLSVHPLSMARHPFCSTLFAWPRSEEPMCADLLRVPQRNWSA